RRSRNPSRKTKRRAVRASPFESLLSRTYPSRSMRRWRGWSSAARPCRRRIRVVYLRHLTRAGVGHLEVRLLLGADHLRREHRRETTDVRVVLLRRLVVIAARHGNTILGARQLILQPQETLVRLELRIRLGDGEQPA